ncbi:MAG: family 43 glycosylhydrolase [Candidatus Kerfeldbacteria bacterium]|nr:family 43 glycosylhydrolase [Candidatus Kerfeldbacteria bacterium]
MDTSEPAGSSVRRSSSFLIRGLFLALIVFLGFLGLWHVVSALVDRDIDGYVAIEFGGDDCVDSYMASYSSALPACDPTAPPTFLESKSDPDTDDDIADHAWMRDSAGLYHLYFQNEDQGSGDDIEHYTSTDLQSLTYVGLALQKNPAGWDSYGLWAPTVVFNPSDGLYYQFYAGTTGPGNNPATVQRIGVATSPDLVTWIKVPVNNCPGTTGDGCVYECNEPWTRWDNGGSYDTQCRDPFVTWDPTTSLWTLFATTRSDPAFTGGAWGQVVTVATSTDLLHWTGSGYIRATKRLFASEGGVGAQLTGEIAENPFITVYDGVYYLFFTDSADPEDYWFANEPRRTQVQYVSSPTLAADATGSANWIYRGYTHDPGVNAVEIQIVEGDTWVASQSIVGNPYSGDRESHLRDLRLKRLTWNPDGTFTTANLTKLSCRVPSGTINPEGTEVCSDGLDNDCNGQTDDPAICGICIDVDEDTYGAEGSTSCVHPETDCDDANGSIYPGATEYCEDLVDNDCDGQVDETGCTVVCVDEDGDGYGASGFSACPAQEPDCDDTDEFINPSMPEQCSDAVDNNCNAQVDEPLCAGVCVDGDNDGYGSSGLLSCPTTTPDCNDAQSSVHPGAIERCDAFDNNCDGRTNENGVCRKTRRIEWTADGEIQLGY